MSGQWELLRCPWCGHEQQPRPVEGKFVMPCSRCEHDDMEIYDLLPVRRPGQAKFVRPAADVDRVTEPKGDEHAADDDGGDRHDDRGADNRPRARAAAPASTAVSSRAYEPRADPHHQDGELSIEPLMQCSCSECRQRILDEHLARA